MPEICPLPCFALRKTDFYASQYDGEAGVDKVLDILYQEFKHCMQLTGCSTILDISKASLAIVRADGPLTRL